MEEIILDYEYYNEKKNINHFDNFIYNDKFEKIGDFELIDDILNLSWDNVLKEKFKYTNIDSKYIIQEINNKNKIRIKHDKWIDDLILITNKQCSRKSLNCKGNYYYQNEKLIIEWDNYEKELFEYDSNKRCYILYNLNNFSNHHIKLYNYLDSEIIIDEYILNKNKILKNNNTHGKISLSNNLVNINWSNSVIKYYKFIKNNSILIDINLYSESKFKLNLNNNIYYFFSDLLISKNNIDIYYLNSKKGDLNIFINDKNDYLFIKYIDNDFKLCNNLYLKVICFENYNWKDDILLNYYSNELYRLSNKNEKGYFVEDGNAITIKWEKWEEESYILEDNIYRLDSFYFREIRFIHNDWDEICKLDKNKIQRSNTETGDIFINKNIIEVSWENWGKDLFYNINDIYYLDRIINKYLIDIYFYLDPDRYYLFEEKNIIVDKNYNLVSNFTKYNDKYELTINNELKIYFRHFFNNKYILFNDEYLRIELIGYNKKIIFIKDKLYYDNNFVLMNNVHMKNNIIYFNEEKFILHKNFKFHSDSIDNKYLTIINTDIIKYRIDYINNSIYDENENYYNFIKSSDLFYININDKVSIFQLLDINENIYISEEIFNNCKDDLDLNYLYFFNSEFNKEECIYRYLNKSIDIYSYKSLTNIFLLLDSKIILNNKIKNNINIFNNNYSINFKKNLDIFSDSFLDNIYYDLDSNCNKVLLKKSLFTDMYIKQEIIYSNNDTDNKFYKFLDNDYVIFIEINKIDEYNYILDFLENNINYKQNLVIFSSIEYDFTDTFYRFKNINIFENNRNFYLSLYFLDKYIKLKNFENKKIIYINNFKNNLKISNIKKLKLDEYNEINLFNIIHNNYDLILYILVWIILNSDIFNKFYNNIFIEYKDLNNLLFKIDRYYN